jgi:peptidyl-prolyl cis-trans isomerase D
MLDRMRRHKSWLKWSLALVVLSFIVFYIPSFLRTGTDAAAPTDAVASVSGQTITVDAFRRAYQSQLQAYQRAYGSSLNEQFLKQMGIDQQILQQLIDERAAAAEAERLGLTVTDQEVAQRIFAIPAFQQNGQFAGPDVYRQVLQMQRPPLTTSEFEDNLRRALLVEKLRSAVTDWISVGEREVDAEYRRRNEKAKFELVVFSADALRDQVTVSDADLAKYFDAHKEQYRVGEKRKIRYLLIDVDALKGKIVVPPGDIEAYYKQNLEMFSTPEQVRASHILLKTEGKDDAAVKKQAEDLLAKIKAGADFAQLATKFSEDEASKAKGGDLDYFGKGQMVPEFDKVAFSLEPGQMSDVVKSQFGYHIIKVTDKKPASKRTLEEVRPQIEDQIKWDRAQAEAERIADDVAGKMKKPEDFDAVARPRGLTVNESPFFSKDEPIPGGRRARLLDERRRGQRRDSHATGLRLHHRGRHAGIEDSHARGGQGPRARRRPQAESDRGGAAEGGRRRVPDEVRRLRRGRQSGGARGENDRSHRARRAGRRHRRQSGGGCRRVPAAAGGRERSRRHEQRRGHREGGREEGRHRLGPDRGEELAARRAAQRTA